MTPSTPSPKPPIERRKEDADDPENHHPSCCGACDTCLRICWGYHGPERRSTVRRQFDRNLAIETVGHSGPHDNASKPNAAWMRKNLEWWTDDAMVNCGMPGDEGFVADAASSDAASRLVEQHNDALALLEGEGHSEAGIDVRKLYVAFIEVESWYMNAPDRTTKTYWARVAAAYNAADQPETPKP